MPKLRRTSAFLLACAAVAAGGRAGAAGVIARGPILQSVDHDSVTIKVELLTPEVVSVEVTGPDGAVKKASAASPSRFQSLLVDGLAPATSYRYKVLAGANNEASEEGRFVTAPSDTRPFKFITYGDSRSDPEAHAAVIRALMASPSDFLVHTGDMVAKGDEEDDWRSFFQVEGKLLRDRCVFASIGNHELLGERGVGASAFLRYFAATDEQGKEQSKLYGTFRWSNTRFFLLNAMDDWKGEERAWLKEALDRSASEAGIVHRIAVLHHGPYSSGPHGGNPRLHDNGVMQIFKEGKVDLVLAGHDHSYERGAGEGIKYIVSGGAGAPLYPKKGARPETAIYESVHHFVEVSVDGDKVDIVAKRASGSVLEACGYVGAGPWSCDKAKPSAGTAPSPPGEAPTRAATGCACSSVPRRSAEDALRGVGALAAALCALYARRRRATLYPLPLRRSRPPPAPRPPPPPIDKQADEAELPVMD